MRSDTYISINDEARPVVEVSPPGSVHEYPSPIAATGAIQRADSSAPRLSVQRVQEATAGEENVVSSSGLRASSAASTDETDSSSIGGNNNEAAKDEAKDEASGGGAGGALNVEMSVDSAYSWVDDLLRIKIDLRVPMQSVSRTVDGVNLKLVDSKDRVSRLQPRCFPTTTPRNERPTTMKPTTNQLEFEWDEYKRRPSMPGIKLDVNVKGDAAEEVPAKPPRQQTTPEPPVSQLSQEANRRTVREEAPRRTSGFVLEDIEKMLGIIPRVEKPSLLDKPGPVGAFAQTSNFVMNEPLKKMVEKQKQIRDEARATSSRPASAGPAVAASVPVPEAFRDRWISRATSTTTSTMTTTSTTTTTTLTTSTTRMTSSNQSDPPSYSTCVSQNDHLARDQQQQRPALIHYAPPSYSAAVTQQFQQQLQNSKESFVSLLEHRRSTSTSSSNNGAETETRSSTWNLASFLKPPRMSPRPMISPSAPPYPANPEAEFYNKLIETAMKGAGPFANQLDIKDVLARTTTFPLMPEPWVPRPMRPYVIGNEEPYRGPETATEYMDQVRSSRAPVAAVPAQQRTTTAAAQQQPRMTADELAACWEDLGATVARPPAPRTPNPSELRVETSHQRIDYGLRVRRDSAGAERSEWDLRIEPELGAAAAARRGPPTASPRRRNELQLDPSVVTDLGMDLRTSLMRAGLPADLQNLNETEYDRALTEMHRVMERAKGMLDNLRK
ncbi:uncharacterized protein LOC106656424 [Trichogramma pretiosum]|uniref:uncharacterized protein LOC106656424 n=1 Tax=Trichogramma pretiosum TaxID=7493 RepID=UPI0006C9B787|nr:uncharacterized protein LOC106656424 [Trichogramma pretiosum]